MYGGQDNRKQEQHRQAWRWKESIALGEQQRLNVFGLGRDKGGR